MEYLRSATEFLLWFILSFHQSIYTTKPIGGTQDPFIVAKAIVKASGGSCLVRNCGNTHIRRTTEHHAMHANVHVPSQSCDALVEHFRTYQT